MSFYKSMCVAIIATPWRRKILFGTYVTGIITSGTYDTYVTGKARALLYDEKNRDGSRYYGDGSRYYGDTKYDFVKSYCNINFVPNLIQGTIFPLRVAYEIISIPLSASYNAVIGAITDSVLTDSAIENSAIQR
jgi:hypothetical protein